MSVINVKHNIIFIRVPRTASTSIGNVSFIGNGSHTRAINIRKIVGRNLRGCPLYNDMFKFGFTRNPWDRLLSGYSYKKDSVNRGEFNEFVKGIDGAKIHLWDQSNPFYLVPQWRYLCDEHERILVDFVGRYENLQEDWEKVCQKLGMYEDLQFYNMGKQLPYKEYYTEETREKVFELYKEDIEIFDYKFDM